MDARSVGRAIFAFAILLALASAVGKGVVGDWEAALRFAGVAVLMYLPRASDVPPSFAAAFATFLLLATWASVQHWYRDFSWFDVLVHFLTPGSLAAVSYFALVHWRLMPTVVAPPERLRPWAPVVWVTAVGLAAATLWEFYEWVVEQISPAGMIVGYTDTIVDLFAGMLGSLVAGLLVLQWGRRHERSRLSEADRAA
ncbi:hypothetical protein ACI8AC_07360 [Geodermatophilus sp. SYSU D00758]